MSLRFEKTTAKHPDYVQLVKALDQYLAVTDGDEHDFYAQYNHSDTIKHIIVAYDENQPAGCGAIKEFEVDCMEVKRMYVRPEFRGKGIATAILKELEEWTRQLRYQRCVLETGKRQPDAIALYKKNDYKLIQNYGQYAEMENSYCFEKQIASTYTTQRLSLKPSDLNDAAFILELFNTPKWIKYIGERNVNTVEDAKQYIGNRMVTQYKSLGYSNFTVINTADQQKMGTCGVYTRDGLDIPDIGFAFLPAFEGKGYAFEAASKVLALAKNKFKLSKVSAITTRENLSSQKLLNKLGLVFKKIVHIPNDPEDLLYYEKTI